jgi:hypothetical protein
MVKIKARTKNSNRPFYKNKWLIAVFTLFIILALLELTNTTHLLHSKKAVSGTIPSSSPTGTSPPSASSESKGSGSTTPPTVINEKQSQTPPVNTNAPLQAPYGTFVSNHHPDANSSEESVCSSTPGASCTIKFTQGSVVKTLSAQTVDGTGTTYWSWNVKQAGITSGSWTVTANASLNGQTKSTQDNLALEIP